MRDVHADFGHCWIYLPVLMATANTEYEAVIVSLGGALGYSPIPNLFITCFGGPEKVPDMVSKDGILNHKL